MFRVEFGHILREGKFGYLEGGKVWIFVGGARENSTISGELEYFRGGEISICHKYHKLDQRHFTMHLFLYSSLLILEFHLKKSSNSLSFLRIYFNHINCITQHIPIIYFSYFLFQIQKKQTNKILNKNKISLKRPKKKGKHIGKRTKNASHL